MSVELADPSTAPPAPTPPRPEPNLETPPRAEPNLEAAAAQRLHVRVCACRSSTWKTETSSTSWSNRWVTDRHSRVGPTCS